MVVNKKQLCIVILLIFALLLLVIAPRGSLSFNKKVSVAPKPEGILTLLPLATAPSCTPDSGFDKCYTYSYKYCHPDEPSFCLEATATIMVTEPPKDYKGRKTWSPAKEGIVKIRCYGKKLYAVYRKYDNLDDIWSYCSYSGCNGGGFKLLKKGGPVIDYELHVKAFEESPYAFVCFDKEYAKKTIGGYIYGLKVWAGVAYSAPFKVHGCYDNTDCESGEICVEDSDGFKRCHTKICEPGTTRWRCEGSTKRVKEKCESGIRWVVVSEDKRPSSKWECKDSVTRVYKEAFCEDGQWTYKVVKEEKCPLGTTCINGQCKSKPSLMDWIIQIS